MMPRIKPLLVLCAALLTVTPAASADVNSDMNQFFNKLGFASNTTQPGVWQGQAAGYAYGGSLYARTQVKNVQLISMTLPDINAGCGGIDAYLGSFSFINGEQLQRFVKQIMSNAAGYFFDLALQTTVPEIKTAKDFLQKMASDINSMNLSSCQAAQGIIGGLFPRTQVSQQKVCQDIAGESNIFADWAASRQGCTVGGKSDSVRDKASDKDKERVTKNINIMWNALSKNRMFDGNKELKEFVMTLTGSLVFGPNGEITPLSARTTDRSIIRAMMEGGTAKISHCNDSDKCLKVVADTPVTISRDNALKSQITKLLASIQNKAVSDTPLDDKEKGFISSTTIPVFKYLVDPQMLGVSNSMIYQLRGVREDQKNGWLFISSNADTHASLKPVISMWLSIAIRGLLAMGENRNRRVWFFCDELPTLHKLPDLVEILPEARKFGGCYVFGIQSYAQLEDIYGEKAAASLFDVMNTRAFFRSPSHKIAEFAAGEIGEKEHLKASEQYSYGADPVRDGVSTGKDMERQTLVSYSDIQSLPDLTCYVTLPGPYPAVKLSLKYQTRPKVAPEFIPRDINPEMENRLSAVLAAREAEGRQMASLFEPDVPEVVSGEDVTQAEQPQQPVSPAINDKKSDSGVNVPAGGIEQELKMKPEEEMEQQLPPGISESGEVVDMAAYEAWQQENHPDIQQQMQRREEVNINVHRERGEDVEPGDDF
ncbi:TPA: F-type conjugal transfer protein TraH [Escherichia coli]|nr:F-type conjugal transfer protein TraH [Escherichia coli]